MDMDMNMNMGEPAKPPPTYVRLHARTQPGKANRHHQPGVEVLVLESGPGEPLGEWILSPPFKTWPSCIMCTAHA